ncbi:MAG: tetratricopeptide repeat protein [Candidatus Loosdrechtia sp.]|uniref:tetratricopeptide repeat protein n=1 Tax=Candidatus Loosdrechtia sp. TaxID=3101272 RepID=UPI003A752A02|nr:MAG: tetratricopeptide repeat protein [Candidatus Jettenia sp. AMX2]
MKKRKWLFVVAIFISCIIIAIRIIGMRSYSDSETRIYTKAKEGHAWAQNILGVRFALGKGVPRDYDIAVYWFHKAAEQGYPSSETNLGEMYYDGKSVSQSYEKAAELFHRAAEKDYSLAQYYLGQMYYEGVGVPQDLLTAYKWFSIARTHSLLGEPEILYTKEKLTPEEVERARVLIGEWLEEHQHR